VLSKLSSDLKVCAGRVTVVVAHSKKRAHALMQEFNLLIYSPHGDGPQPGISTLTAEWISSFENKEQ